MTSVDVARGTLVSTVRGVDFVVAERAVEGAWSLIPPALCCTVVISLLIPFIKGRGLSWKCAAVVGLMAAGQFSALHFGLRAGVGAGVAATILHAQAAFTAMSARTLWRRRVMPVQWIGVMVTVVGLGVIVVDGAAAPSGAVLLILLGAVSWAASNIALGKACEVDPVTMGGWQSIVVFGPLLLSSTGWGTGHLLGFPVIGVVTIVIALVVSVYAWHPVIRRLGPVSAVSLSPFVSLVAFLCGWITFGSGLTAVQSVGVVLSFLGLTLVVTAFQITSFFCLRVVPGEAVESSAER